MHDTGRLRHGPGHVPYPRPPGDIVRAWPPGQLFQPGPLKGSAVTATAQKHAVRPGNLPRVSFELVLKLLLTHREPKSLRAISSPERELPAYLTASVGSGSCATRKGLAPARAGVARREGFKVGAVSRTGSSRRVAFSPRVEKAFGATLRTTPARPHRGRMAAAPCPRPPQPAHRSRAPWVSTGPAPAPPACQEARRAPRESGEPRRTRSMAPATPCLAPPPWRPTRPRSRRSARCSATGTQQGALSGCGSSPARFSPPASARPAVRALP